jgi:hypothetical protein
VPGYGQCSEQDISVTTVDIAAGALARCVSGSCIHLALLTFSKALLQVSAMNVRKLAVNLAGIGHCVQQQCRGTYLCHCTARLVDRQGASLDDQLTGRVVDDQLTGQVGSPGSLTSA